MKTPSHPTPQETNSVAQSSRPELAALQHKLPNLEQVFLQDFIQRLPDRYFLRFTPKEQVSHALALSRLAADNPVEVLSEEQSGNRIEITILAFDYQSAFAIITGILASLGLNIINGDIFTYAPADRTAVRQTRHCPPRIPASPAQIRSSDRRIIDHFSCILDRTDMAIETWQQQLREKFHEIFQLLESTNSHEKPKQAKRRVDEMVAERLASLARQTGPNLSPVIIEADNQAGSFTRLKVTCEDTPAFLYAFSNSLALQKLSIEQVKIRTTGHKIEDEIDIVDVHGKPITDPVTLNQIKLSALITKHFTYFLGASPNPFDALSRFEQMLDDILQLPEQGKWTNLLAQPKILQDLARLLGASDFMWEDFIRQQYESLLPMMTAQAREKKFSLPPPELLEKLREKLDRVDTMEGKKKCLNEFKDREIYMIDLDHILTPGVDFKGLAAALTNLAELIVGTAAEIVYQHLTDRYGVPRTVAGLPARYTILGLGKMGGAALGYASDIELLFVYSDNGRTDGDKTIGNAEFFNHLVQQTVRFITTKQEGIFTIDLRLRPYGNDGPPACSLESFCRYYSQDGDAHSFEKLALVRLRWLVGDRGLGQQLERIRDQILYFSHSLDLAQLRALRVRQFREKNRPGQVNAKFSPGGLVDLEYDVQILQIMYGRNSADLRTPRLHQALEALAEAGVISDNEARMLTEAYDFLRRLINGLRMLRGSARDLFLPAVEADEFTHLARRMGYQRGENLGAAQQLQLDFETCTAVVRTFVERHFGRESLPGPSVGNVADLVLSDNINHELGRKILEQAGYRNPQRALVNLRRLCQAPNSRETFARLAVLACDLLRRQPDPDLALNNWEKFMAGQNNHADFYAMLLSQPRRLEIMLAIFAASQFLADTMARNRDFLDWLTQPEILHRFRPRQAIETDLAKISATTDNYEQWLDQLRMVRRRELLRIGARDVCLHLSTETIIAELSHLAEAITRTAYLRVLRQVARENPDIVNFTSLTDRFCIIAFGKLGGGELNYSSDIDLLAIYQPDQTNRRDSRKLHIYNQLMERTCSALSRHTGEGHAYRVDLRLRPYGRGGELVNSISSLEQYYQKAAAPWELQALLKVRPIAGADKLGQQFMRLVRDILGKPRPSGEIIDSIRKMRKTAVTASRSGIIHHGLDLKNGSGGIRDIEFLVQSRQLQLAPAHPELITGHTLTALRRLAELGSVSDQTAQQIEADYLFLRRVEHCLQIFEDRQVHRLPTRADELTALARRLFGPRADQAIFMQTVAQCMERVDQFFKQELYKAQE